jgi:phosphatidylglycerol:prolipoprotein diacylglycerol transferase
MRPILFSIGDLPIPSYGVVYLAAFLAAIFTGSYLASREGLSWSRCVDAGFLCAIGGELGARLTFVAVEWSRFTGGLIPWRQFLYSGRVVLGGVIAGAVTLVWALRRFGFPVLRFFEAAAVGVILGMAIGRLGCLLAGCCFGKPTDLWWGVTFTDELARRYSGTPLNVALHPTQVLLSLSALVAFGVLLRLHPRRKFDGQVAGLSWVFVGLSRFLVEFLRGDARGEALGLSTSQWLGVGSVVIGVLWLAVGISRGTCRGLARS